MLYGIFFIRFPKLDLSTSTYATECLNELTDQGSDFSIVDTFTGAKVVSLNKNDPRYSTFAYNNENSDVIIKLICAQGYMPANLGEFNESAIHSPYYNQIAMGAKNYQIILFRPAFMPTWTEFFVRVLGGLFVVWFLWLVGRALKPTP